MALVSRTQNMVGVTVLNFGRQVTLPATFAEGVTARHEDWLVPVGDGQVADFALNTRN